MSVINGRRPGESLEDFLNRRRQEKAAATAPSAPAYDPDLIPNVTPARSTDDDAISTLLDGESIVDGYRRWCGKMEPNVGGKRESIMVSCPNPIHPDQDPSAWVNLDKNTGNCPLCGGFDNYDIFAWNNGRFNKDTYRTDGTFPTMRRTMAADLGYVVRRTPGGAEYVDQIAHEEPAPSVAAEPAEDDMATVVRISGDPEEPSTYEACPPIDWRLLLDDDSTFLREWMQTCSLDDLPEEFYFWLGLMALGCAVGNHVKLKDRWAVRANLLLCLVGPTGMGKSRSTRALYDLMHDAFPYRVAQPGGVKMIAVPGSAESLIDEFCVPLYDPNDPNTIIGYQPTKGIVRFDELASLASRAARNGSAIKPHLMEFYDSDGPIRIRSRGSNQAKVVEARDHFAQIIATTQPRAMREMLSQADNDSGFLNRWVFATGTPKKLTSIGGDLIDVGPHVDAIRDIRAWGATVRLLPLEDDAIVLWDEFFHRELMPMKLDEDASVYVRVDLLLKKLMLLLAIDKKQTTITLRTVQQALSLWPYLSATYSHADSAVTSSEVGDLEHRLMTAIDNGVKSLNRAVSINEIRKRMGEAVWKKLNKADVLKQMEVLTKLGILKEISVATSTKGGRPTLRYEIVDDGPTYST